MMKPKKTIKSGTIAGIFAIALMAGCGGAAERSNDANEAGQVQEAVEGTVSIVTESGQESAEDAAGKANLELTADSYDFGTVTEGAQVEHTYTFTNTGEEPLILTRVSASCGCTTPEYSKTPIAPGAEGSVKVVFDSNGQVGQHHKIITVANNGINKIVLLHLRGEVTAK